MKYFRGRLAVLIHQTVTGCMVFRAVLLFFSWIPYLLLNAGVRWIFRLGDRSVIERGVERGIERRIAAQLGAQLAEEKLSTSQNRCRVLTCSTTNEGRSENT